MLLDVLNRCVFFDDIYASQLPDSPAEHASVTMDITLACGRPSSFPPITSKSPQLINIKFGKIAYLN
jgi:hypothetical protein